MFKRVLLLLLLLTQTAVAELALTEQDFAFNADISTGKQSVRQFELPYEVLQAIQQQDYADMRIFNSQNQIVPFSVTVTKPQLQQHTTDHELDFFTLPKNSQQHTRLQIEIDKYRHHFNVSTVPDEKDKLSYIIIKNFYSKQGLDKLKLDWNTLESDFSLKLKLEQSDDLVHWKVIKHKTTLYHLKQSSTQLIKDVIYLPRKNYANYLRLSFTNQNDFLKLMTKITGYSNQQSQAEIKNWKSLILKQGEVTHEWLFNTESMIPVAKIAFEIPQTGLLYQGALYSKPDVVKDKQVPRKRAQFKKEVKKVLHYPNRRDTKPYDGWQYRQSFTQYRLLTESGEINSQAMSMSGVIKDSQWRIMLKQPLTLLPDQIPKINIAWHPIIVTFLAQGEEPYRLLFGNASIKSPQSGFLHKLTDSQIETVSLGAINALEKPVSSTDPESTMTSEFKKMNWQVMLLWLLLCSFVLLMMVMAYKLYLNMNK